MRVPCPHCHKVLNVADKAAGRTLACPACQQPITVPTSTVDEPTPVPSVGLELEDDAPARPRPRPVRPMPVQPPSRRRPRHGGGTSVAGLIVIVLIVTAMACVGFMVYFKEAPDQAFAHVAALVRGQPWPPPTTKPVPADVSAPVEPAAVPTLPETTVVVAPPPEAAASAPPVAPVVVDESTRVALTWLMEHASEQPRSVTLTQDVALGRTGSPLKSGTLVPLTRIVNLESVIITINGANYRIPSTATTIGQLAVAAQTQAAAAEEESAESMNAALAAMPTEPVAAPEPVAPASIPAPVLQESADDVQASSRAKTPFVHPGMLHNEADFERMRTNLRLNREPWKSGWEKLVTNSHCSLNWNPSPVAVVVRGKARYVKEPQNYRTLFRDAAAAYACALRWKITREQAYGDKAIEIINAWSAVLTRITGSTDGALAAGLQGYQFANAAEIMRSYKRWKSEDFVRCKKMMVEVFLSYNVEFLTNHFGRPLDHYWANWDLANMASVMAIGILCDDRATYNKAVNYFKFGGGNGAIRNAVVYVHPGNLGQWQEAGRDQGHSTMGVPLMGTICEMAWKQGDDLYGYDNNRFLAGCEYIAKYNLGEDVPYKEYRGSTQVSPHGRGMLRPGWELVYNHYVVRRGLPAPWTTKMAAKVRPEGGGSGPNSGSYDQLGYGTLTATLDPAQQSGRSGR